MIDLEEHVDGNAHRKWAATPCSKYPPWDEKSIVSSLEEFVGIIVILSRLRIVWHRNEGYGGQVFEFTPDGHNARFYLICDGMTSSRLSLTACRNKGVDSYNLE
jgi:hypothetical protein